jgi:hypothetical protein
MYAIWEPNRTFHLNSSSCLSATASTIPGRSRGTRSSVSSAVWPAAALIDTLAGLVVHYAPLAGTRTLAKVAQSVEHSTENAGVGGSIPPLGTRISSIVSSRHSRKAHLSPSLTPMQLTPP